MSDLTKFLLLELSNAEPDNIESNEIEICGEDESGVDGCCTEQITKIAELALNDIEELEQENQRLREELKSAAGYIKFNRASLGTDWEKWHSRYLVASIAQNKE